MKAILWLKRFDLLAQLLALCIPALLGIASGEYFTLFYAYFFVGGAQVLSFIVHAAGGLQQWNASGRGQYGRLLAWTIAVSIIVVPLAYLWAGDGPVSLCVGILYLFATPIMAVWYFSICRLEVGRVARAAGRGMLIIRSV